MSYVKTIRCDRCQSIIDHSKELYSSHDIVVETQNKSIAEQTKQDLEIKANLHLCCKCCIDVLYMLLDNEADPFTTLKDMGVIAPPF